MTIGSFLAGGALWTPWVAQTADDNPVKEAKATRPALPNGHQKTVKADVHTVSRRSINTTATLRQENTRSYWQQMENTI